MLGLDRVQYWELRIALCLMEYTPNNCLGVLCGIPDELQIPCCCFLSIGSPFEGEAWSAVVGAEHGSLHQRIFQCFSIEYSSIRVLHAA
jgi:hypothetical protein